MSSHRKPFMITHEDMEREWEEAGASRRQCRAIFRRSSGVIIFCRRPIAHDGDHRGHRAQWPEQDLL